MCKHGTTTPVDVTIAAHLSHTGEERRATKPIDACIAPIVAALEVGGIKMLSSCCGHGRGPGEVMLADGRRLVIVPCLGAVGAHSRTGLDRIATKAAWLLENGATNEAADMCEDVIALRAAQDGDAEHQAFIAGHMAASVDMWGNNEAIRRAHAEDDWRTR